MLKKLFKKYPALRYCLSSFAAWLTDNGLYFLFVHLVFPSLILSEVLLSTVSLICARVLSSFFNFNCNKFFVFDNNEPYGRACFKYYCLCVPQTIVSVVVLDIFISQSPGMGDLLQTALKIVIEGVLFIICYIVQRKWVFRKKQ